MFIAHTTILWTSEWLLDYEIWPVTGQWHGGGHGTPQLDPQAVARPIYEAAEAFSPVSPNDSADISTKA
jgi:hypothetical protein